MKSFEDILKEKLSTPVELKGKMGVTIMPMEAMVMSVMNNAMKGDISSIAFIRNISSQREEPTDEEKIAKQKLFTEALQGLHKELVDEGLASEIKDVNLERLAHELLTIRRIESIMEQNGHRDIEEKTMKDGSSQNQLSAINRIYGDLLKQFRQDMKEHRMTLIQKMNNRKYYTNGK